MKTELKPPLKIKGSGDKDELCDAEGACLATAVQLLPMLEVVRRVNAHDALVEALEDMLSGWLYIRQSHGDLYGVGWDRAQAKAEAALALAKEGK